MKIFSKNKKTIIYCIAIIAVVCCVGFVRTSVAQKNTVNTSVSVKTQTPEIINRSVVAEEIDAEQDIQITSESTNQSEEQGFSVSNTLKGLLHTTGIYAFFTEKIEKTTSDGKINVTYGWQKAVMILIAFVLLYLGGAKGFEPLLLIPIGFGTMLVNVPLAGMGDAPHGFLYMLFETGIQTELFPLIIFMGVGAMTDFGALIANPRTALLGAAAQFGIFGSLIGAICLNFIPGINFSMRDVCAISIIGGADGPTSIYVASKLAPEMLGSIAVAAYSYMALVPLIQPPIMRALTTKKERCIKMQQLREVSKIEKIIFPLIVLSLCVLFVPSSVPLIGAFTFGNFIKEIGVVERLSKTMQNELLNIVTIFLGLGVGMQMSADKFMQPSSLGILLIGLIAFTFGTAAGVIFGKIMNLFSKDKINPLIGAAGVSAVPMAARVANKVGMEEDPSNFLLMHAMGPNVAGVIGSAIAAGVMISMFG